MEERVIETRNGSFTVKQNKRGLELIRYQGNAAVLHLGEPEEFDAPIISIEKKAFLSSKELRRITLPDSVRSVGDWAFAFCGQLQEVVLPHHQISWGKGIFRECIQLAQIYSMPKEDTPENLQAAKEVGYLLAATQTLLDAGFLFTPAQAGDADWLASWDARMLHMIRLDDHEGYAKMLLCGEEDYGTNENDLDFFLNQKRRAKASLIYLRLLHPIGLSPEVRQELEAYLLAHTAGEASAEAWEIVLAHGREAEYYKLFTELGALTADNFDRVLQDIGDHYPEMKAYFMRFKETNLGYSDFFSDLLDL